jgi:ADP-dependent NAD(P)H-hydrate dehydratase / NAD(P)H-hydrate epimerase
MNISLAAHPILSAEETKSLEQELFHGDEPAEWAAMSKAGAAVAGAVLRDWQELRAWPKRARLLVLAGKGHNAGDALIAARSILDAKPHATAEILFVFPQQSLRPLAMKAFREIAAAHPHRVTVRRESLPDCPYDVALDGVFGFQFRPPLDERLVEKFARIRRLDIGMRVAVDLPSGLGDPSALAADFTYATGVLKAEAINPEHAGQVGRLRYLDLGFFDEPPSQQSSDDVLTDATLTPLQRWRSPIADKRAFGHLFVVGGSRSYPGAVMMAVQAALRAGVGLLTAFVPESLVSGYAAHVPEAMWVGCPETPDGGIALESLHLLRERQNRATAFLIGPGLTRDKETLAFAAEAVAMLQLPSVVDADALQPEIVRHASGRGIVTPHAGEFKRIAADTDLRSFAAASGLVTVLKGAPTRISDGQRIHYSLAGGPVLARGGSGDTLAGMIGGLLAQSPQQPLEAACTGTLWHGLAADALARRFGPVAVHTTELLDFLSDVLRTDQTDE